MCVELRVRHKPVAETKRTQGVAYSNRVCKCDTPMAKTSVLFALDMKWRSMRIKQRFSLGYTPLNLG